MNVKARPRTVIVEMIPYESFIKKEEKSSLIIPEHLKVAAAMAGKATFTDHPFQGKVIYSGISDIKPGDKVCVRFPMIFKSPDVQMPNAPDGGKLHINPAGEVLFVGDKDYSVINEGDILAVIEE